MIDVDKCLKQDFLMLLWGGLSHSGVAYNQNIISTKWNIEFYMKTESSIPVNQILSAGFEQDLFLISYPRKAIYNTSMLNNYVSDSIQNCKRRMNTNLGVEAFL